MTTRWEHQLQKKLEMMEYLHCTKLRSFIKRNRVKNRREKLRRKAIKRKKVYPSKE